MTTTIYTCRTTFGFFRFAADFSEASSPIYALADHGGLDHPDVRQTPLQVADAGHSPRVAARMVMQFLGRDYWLNPDDLDYTVTYVEDGEQKTETFDGLDDAEEFAGADDRIETTYAGMDEVDYIDSLIEDVAAEDA